MTNRARSLSGMILALLTFAPALAGGVITQMTSSVAVKTGLESLDDAGSVVIGSTNANLGGQNPGMVPSIYSWNAASGAATLLWSFPAGVRTSDSGLSDDGAWVAFVTSADLTGGNPSGAEQLFLRRTDGSETRQLTPTTPGDEGTFSKFALAGSGNRAVFIASIDPLGLNSTHDLQLFVVDTDGTNFRQLTTVAWTVAGYAADLSISDDGTRIAFIHAGDLTGGNADGTEEVFAVDADGSNLRQLTSGLYPMYDVRLSGNGSRIAFVGSDNLGGQNPSQVPRVWIMDWSGSGLAPVSTWGASPSITDDGQYIFHSGRDIASNRDAIWRVRYDGTGTTQLTLAEEDYTGIRTQVSGDGSRVTFVTYDAKPLRRHQDVPTVVMDSSGGNQHELMENDVEEIASPELTADGTRLVFSSSANSLGTNPDRLMALFKMQTDGAGLTQVTAFAEGDVHTPTVSDDGQKFSFFSDADPLGSNPSEKFAPFAVRADGTQLTMLDDPHNSIVTPMISGSGNWVVFQSLSHAAELLRSSSTGTGQLQISNDGTGAYKHPRVDATGFWVVYSTNDGIWRVTTSNTNRQQITNYYGRYPDVSGLGTRYVWISTADPLGTNADGSYEIFSWDASINLYRQLTTLPAGSSIGRIRISRDGAYVTFFSNAPIFGTPGLDVYRLHVATGTIERVGGLQAQLNTGGNQYGDFVAISSNGSKLAFATVSNATGNNLDGSREVFFVDMTRIPAIRVGATSPTVVSWDADPHAVKYDVVRGDVAKLALAGSTVDLGVVSCLADDLSAMDTAAGPDAGEPAPGQAFFYVLRGSSGPLAGPGSYGQGTGARERVAGAGACAP